MVMIVKPLAGVQVSFLVIARPCGVISWSLQEYQDGNDTLEITNTNAKQAVYVFRCNKSTLQVKGKVNSIILGELIK